MERTALSVLFALLLPACASAGSTQGVEDEYKELRWPAYRCSLPALSGRPAKEIPAVKGGRSEQFPEVAALGKDILTFREAYEAAYKGYQRSVELSHGHCPRTDDFMDLVKLHQDAIEKRKKELIGHFPEDMIEYVSAREFRKRGRGEESVKDVFGLRTACRRPDPPPRLKLPAAGSGNKVLESLREDSLGFYGAQLAIHAAHVRLMELGEAYNCRELHMSYRSMVWRLYEGFYARRRDDLARVAEGGVDWELTEAPAE